MSSKSACHPPGRTYPDRGGKQNLCLEVREQAVPVVFVALRFAAAKGLRYAA